jgi:hypothetical protein
VDVQAADAERVVAALIGARDEAVERDGHVACGWCHVSHDHRIDAKSSVGDNLANASACHRRRVHLVSQAMRRKEQP